MKNHQAHFQMLKNAEIADMKRQEEAEKKLNEENERRKA